MSDDFLKEILIRELHSLIGHLHLMLAGEEEVNMKYLSLAEDLTEWWNARSSR